MAIKLTKEDAEMLRTGLRQAFDASDLDKNGQIDVKEFERVLRLYNSSNECVHKVNEREIKANAQEFIRDADKNGDGKVSFKEFHKYMLQSLGVKE